MSSHDFSSEGEVSIGAYACDEDNNDNIGGDDATLRIGNCDGGRGNATWTMDNGEEITFTVAWQNDVADVYVDGSLLGTISGAPSSTGTSCTEHTFALPSSASSTIEVEVVDPSRGCTGDIQIASVCVTGEGMFQYSIFFLNCSDFFNGDRVVAFLFWIFVFWFDCVCQTLTVTRLPSVLEFQ